MSDDVITGFIKNSGKSYKLSADDIIYLNNQGVSQAVISTLQQTAPPANQPSSPVASAPATPPSTSSQPVPVQIIINQNTPSSAPQPTPQVAQVPPAPPTEAPPQGGPEINFDYFHDQLAPFGTWVNVDGAMYWHPDQAIAANPDWRPYYDMGQWVQTDNGLFWQSDYTWGDIPFHYGRWVLNPVQGWLWAPDYTWGPAWVCWRQADADGCIGWAPLPVGAVFVNGVLMFNGVAVDASFGFGLGESCFTFVSYDHFHEGFFRMRGHEWSHNIGRERLHTFYGHSVIRNEFSRDEHGMFVNNGIGRDRIERLTRVAHSSFEERRPVGDRNQLAKERSERPGTGNGGHPGEVHPGTHIGGGNTGNTGHPGGANSGSLAGGGGSHGNTGQGERGSVSKVFRPPMPTANRQATSAASKPATSATSQKKKN
jgi:hypothetical protein